MKTRIVSILLLLFIAITTKAQQSELRALFSTQLQFNSDWKASLDGGYYGGIGNANWVRWGIRGIAQRRINSLIRVDAGFMYNNTHTVGITTHEFRPHQTVKFSYPRFARMTINHRFRLEEQIITNNIGNDVNISSRFRYEIKTKRAMNLKKFIEPKMPYWIGSMEFTMNFSGHIKGERHLFERGRYGLGAGYRVDTNTSIEATYYFQHTHKSLKFHEHNDLNIFNFCIIRNIFVP